jgi:hypothetical protein
VAALSPISARSIARQRGDLFKEHAGAAFL